MMLQNLVFFSFIATLASCTSSVIYLSEEEWTYISYMRDSGPILCSRRLGVTLLDTVLEIDDVKYELPEVDILHGKTPSELLEWNVCESSELPRYALQLNFSTGNNITLRFFDGCCKICPQQDILFQARARVVPKISILRLLCLLAGLYLWWKSDYFAQQIWLYYAIGSGVSLLALFIVLLLVIYKFLPFKKFGFSAGFAAILVGAFGTATYFISALSSNILEFVLLYREVVIVLVLATACISLLLMGCFKVPERLLSSNYRVASLTKYFIAFLGASMVSHAIHMADGLHLFPDAFPDVFPMLYACFRPVTWSRMVISFALTALAGLKSFQYTCEDFHEVKPAGRRPYGRTFSTPQYRKADRPVVRNRLSEPRNMRSAQLFEAELTSDSD